MSVSVTSDQSDSSFVVPLPVQEVAGIRIKAETEPRDTGRCIMCYNKKNEIKKVPPQFDLFLLSYENNQTYLPGSIHYDMIALVSTMT